jgi:TolA-binding protein
VEQPVPFFERLRGLLLRPALVTAGVAGVVFVISYFIGSNMLETDRLDQAVESAAPFVGPAVPMEAEEERVPAPIPEPLARASASTPDVEGDLTVAAQQDLQPAENLGTGDAPRPGGGSLGTAGPPPLNSAAQLKPQAPPAVAQAEPEADVFDDFKAAGEMAAKSKAEAVAAAPVPQAEESEAYFGDDARFYRDGMDAYNRGDCPTATIALRKVVDPPHDSPELVPSALHHVARCEKRTGRCGKAVIAYDELLNRFPGYKGRAEAMWEAAACHRRLGHVDQAWKLLDGLAQIPAWRDRARAEQKNLEPLKNPE